MRALILSLDYKLRQLVIFICLAPGLVLANDMQPKLVTESVFDVCVYGETASGVIAAIQVAKMGKKAILVSTNDHVGGVATSGLTATDLNNYRIAGGLTRIFYQKLYQYYQNPAVWRNETRPEFFERSKKRTFTGKNDSLQMQWVYESKVAEQILKNMLAEAGVAVVYNQKLDLNRFVEKKSGKIQSINMMSGMKIKAQIFIDATYEGDLMSKSGVSYIVGREDNKQYGERLNGISLNHVIGKDSVSIDPYIIPGNPASGLLPFIEAKLPAPEGTGDKKTQAYCYRMTLTNDPDNMIEIQKPANYNPLWYEFLARMIMMNPGISLSNLITFTPMPNKKTDTNHADFVGASYEWPEADYAKRALLAQMHKDYALGLLWFFGHDERLPESMRKEMKTWGLPKDEFTDTQNFPYQIYVREARRMVSDYVMTEKNCNGTTPVEDVIAIATYPLDCHYVSRVIDEKGRLRAEGSYGKQKSTYYGISFRSIIPAKKECKNLLVPICLSASHVAYSSIRMEPVYMVLGQSAGTAAVMALNRKNTVQKIAYEDLQQQMLQDGQILSLKRK